MDVMGDLANVSTILGGFSVFGVFGAGVLWSRKQIRNRRERRAAIELRDWQGYIDVHSINAWRVRLLEEPDSPSARVVLEVVNDKGEPDVNQAQNLRERVANDGMLARVPSVAEREFLTGLYTERRHDGGLPIS